jgi:hypothetical protein
MASEMLSAFPLVKCINRQLKYFAFVACTGGDLLGMLKDENVATGRIAQRFCERRAVFLMQAIQVAGRDF